MTEIFSFIERAPGAAFWTGIFILALVGAVLEGAARVVRAFRRPR